MLRGYTRRAIKRAMFLLIGVFVLHIFLKQYKQSDIYKIHELKEDYINIQLNDAKATKDIENPLKLSKEDMLDEYGKPYKILLLTGNEGTPIYKANPYVCRANISCQIEEFTLDQVDSAHAIVLQASTLQQLKTRLPPKRNPSQLYVWWTLESPLHTPIVLGLDKYFNMTFHYRKDADVYAPYGSLNLLLREMKITRADGLYSLLEKKRIYSDKVAVWAVSNCYLKRYVYGKTLMDLGLKVDTFGRCFGKKELGDGRYSKSFYDRISEYKFYLAFENSLNCKDYITEKFWYNSLKAGTVPVVWGARKEDLLKVAPTKSFIHTDDFSSPQDLISYLNYLTTNETAYAEYLQWRTWVNEPWNIEPRLRIENNDYDLRSFCKLCSVLEIDGKKRKMGVQPPLRIIPSLIMHWIGAEEGKCHM